MKKITLVLTLIALLLCGTAFAREVKPVGQYDMNAPLVNGDYYIGFQIENISDTGVYAEMYAQDLFENAEIAALAQGDVIYIGGMPVEVNKVSITDNEADINGGFDADGVTLFKDANLGIWTPIEWELPTYTLMGMAQLNFADKVTVSVYRQGEEGEPLDEYDTFTVPASGVKALFDEIAAGHEDIAYTPDGCTVRVNDGAIIAITIDYVP